MWLVENEIFPLWTTLHCRGQNQEQLWLTIYRLQVEAQGFVDYDKPKSIAIISDRMKNVFAKVSNNPSMSPVINWNFVLVS